MPNRNRKSRKNNRRHSGGGQGSGWTPGGPLLPGVQSYAQVNQTYDACVSAPRPGQISYSSAGGLPGMSGGAYTNNLAAGPLAGFAQIDKIPCSPNYVNPQNAVGTHQAFVYPQTEGLPAQKGGVGLQSAQDMGVYEAPTARYTHVPSQWTGSTGAPVLLNQALNPTQWSKACTTTAGGSRRTRNSTRAKRNRKKNRRNSTRANRKTSRR
jgi:hypothetical protein